MPSATRRLPSNTILPSTTDHAMRALAHQALQASPAPAPLTMTRSSGDDAAAPAPAPERNIDNVVLGDLMFQTWYPSYHVKEIIGKDVVDGPPSAGSKYNHYSGGVGVNGARAQAGTAAPSTGILLDRLYVCNRCFKYSKELLAWKAHLRVCDKPVPGRRIYTHGRGTSEEGTWSVYEVDGEDETLYCQNLSLFAKLFLDTKSVFFDVTGFNYFLLVHTAPPPPHVPAAAAPPRDQQVVGFFSKEKMSWDHNNLACILIFPPWQRKNLGLLLIGVSYEISRRQRVLGGPEKPISTLGRKSYRRYWQAEILRFLLEADALDGVPASPAARRKDRRDDDPAVLSIDRIAQATWICHDDVLLTLREMGVAQLVGGEHWQVGEDGAASVTEGSPAVGEDDTGSVRIDKAALRRWLQATGTRLDHAIDAAGFVEGYAMAEDEAMGG